MTKELGPPSVDLNETTANICKAVIDGKTGFTFYFPSFMDLQLKFRLRLDGNMTAVQTADLSVVA